MWCPRLVLGSKVLVPLSPPAYLIVISILGNPRLPSSSTSPPRTQPSSNNFSQFPHRSFFFNPSLHCERRSSGNNSGDQLKMVSPENPNWLVDYGLTEDISVSVGDFPVPATAGFSWTSQPLYGSTSVSVEIDGSFGDTDALKDIGSRKRVRSGTSNPSGSKACREKLRRDRLNDRFVELASILDPERPPKIDKAAILTDAVRMVTQLRSEAQKLKDSNESLHEKIKELKVEKNELRDEKQRLKVEKEKLEQQVKATTAQPGFLPHPPAISSPFTAQAQAAGNKLMPFIGYPGVAMWQFMPPAAVDTSQDHVLRPPVA